MLSLSTPSPWELQLLLCTQRSHAFPLDAAFEALAVAIDTISRLLELFVASIAPNVQR